MRKLIVAAALVAATPALADQPASPPAASAVALLGPALNVSQIDRELHFYVDGLGMKQLMRMGAPQRRETMLGFASSPGQPGIILLDDATVTNSPPRQMGTAFDRLVMRVSGLPEVVARLRSLGFTVSDVRAVAKGYSMAQATDPEGYRLELVESSGSQGH